MVNIAFKRTHGFCKKMELKSNLVENGDLVLLDNNKRSTITNKIPAGRKALKGNQIISVDSKYFQNIKKYLTMANFLSI